MMRPSHVAGIVCALLVSILSCDDDPTGPGGPDTSPPAIKSVEAIDAGNIKVTFAEAVTPESASNVSHYRLRDVALDEQVGILAAVVRDSRTVVLNPVPTEAVDYELSVSWIEDLYGNSLESNQVTSTFRASTDEDRTSPMLVWRSPEGGARNVALDQPIELQFSEAVFHRQVIVVGEGEELDIGLVGYGGYDRFEIRAPFKSGTTYTVTLSGITDIAGNVMPYAKWSFTTTGVRDVTPPTIDWSSPYDSATDVPLDHSILIDFSEMIDRESFVLNITPVAAGDAYWFGGGDHLWYIPNAPLLPETEYVISLPAGAFKDVAGNPNVEPYTITFTTGSSPPPSAP